MSVLAIYNMKGGVGKTTTAVNLSYLAAAAGQRVLLWDLDPQAASSFAFRVRPRVEGFRKKWVQSGDLLAAGIRETDYSNLDLLPADFTHRKLERVLGAMSKPAKVVTGLLDTLRRQYDLVVLDCPAGFSLLTEGVFAAADAIVVPTIPTVLSVRMVATLIEWAVRADSPCDLMAFFSMVDRRKTLHRRICEWSSGQSEFFLAGQVPYASVVEQMAVRRMPLATFAPRDAATESFRGLWTEIQTRLRARTGSHRPHDRRRFLLRAIESLVVRLESEDVEPAVSLQPVSPTPTASDASAVRFIHRFDTDRRDLERYGWRIELHERTGRLLLVAGKVGPEGSVDATKRADVQIDASWATSILAGAMSPLDALERRLGLRPPAVLEHVRGATHGRSLRRVNSRAADAAVRLGRAPDAARDLGDELHLSPLRVGRHEIALGHRREATLRAHGDLLDRDVL